MAILEAQAAEGAYDPTLPSTIYFQSNCMQTHVQGGRVFDSIGNQYPPDVKALWQKGMAAPFDLQQSLLRENLRRKIEAEMAAKYAEMERAQQANLDRVNKEIQDIQDREMSRMRGPINTAPPAEPAPMAPEPIVMPEMEDLDMLQQLVPITPQRPANHLGLQIVSDLSSRIKNVSLETPTGTLPPVM